MKETLSCPNAFNVKASNVNKLNDTINPINDNYKGIFFCEIKKPNNSNGSNKNTASNSALNLPPIPKIFCINVGNHRA